MSNELSKWPYFKKLLPWIILVILELIVIIIMISRLRAKEVEIRTEYIKGDTVKVTTTVPVPTYIKTNVDTTAILEYCLTHDLYKEYFYKDSIIRIIDTVKVFQDWSDIVYYNIELFNIDTVGKCSIETSVQYNRLGEINTTFEPIIKVVTTRKPRVWEPFIGLGFSTQIEGSILTGVYYKNWGFSASYNQSFNKDTKNNVSFQVYRKF